MAPGRTVLYTIWRCCERWSILPPNVKTEFYSNDTWTIALLLAYEQVRQLEDTIPEVKLPRLPKKYK